MEPERKTQLLLISAPEVQSYQLALVGEKPVFPEDDFEFKLDKVGELDFSEVRASSLGEAIDILLTVEDIRVAPWASYYLAVYAPPEIRYIKVSPKITWQVDTVEREWI
ncbi:MAG: hypothetical protein LBT47_01170 [Deltaproteobacteria bacterium]|jgi:hypothetical protein|nr:hypothetical protein [Deltaproteobacteria bacterium]